MNYWNWMTEQKTKDQYSLYKIINMAHKTFSATVTEKA